MRTWSLCFPPCFHSLCRKHSQQQLQTNDCGRCKPASGRSDSDSPPSECCSYDFTSDGTSVTSHCCWCILEVRELLEVLEVPLDPTSGQRLLCGWPPARCHCGSLSLSLSLSRPPSLRHTGFVVCTQFDSFQRLKVPRLV